MNSNHTFKTAGFSFIELMLTLAILGILITIAYPGYSSYIVKTNRIKAEQSLYYLAQKLELYHTEKQTYLDANINTIASGQQLNTRYYQFRLNNLSENSFEIAATPKQIDTECGTLMLDQIGRKQSSGASKTSECWSN